MSDPDVIIVGEIYIDHVMSGFERWPQPGEEIVSERYTREIGGGAAITACALARLGRSVELAGFIGVDDKAWFERRLAEFGVPTRGLRVVAGATGVTLSVSTREDRSFFTHAGLNLLLEKELLADEFVARATGARHVHFAMPLAQAAAQKLLPALAAVGCTTSLDVGYQPRWLTDEANHAICQAVDYVLPNEKEAALLTQSHSPEDYFRFARKLGLPNAIVKLGAKGAMACANGATIAVAPPAVTAIDSTGSGDAFDAGFIDALLDGAELEQRLRRACICGALSTRAAGALAGLPDRHELWSTYEQTYGS